ncbi:hypothetical protein A2U01_0053234, partial [Trifolium medium]|nr:hypothetical protein [Trifolium medium]
VIYERLPEYCNHCYSIGHSVANCCKLHPQEKPVEKAVKVQVQKQYIPKQSTAPVIDLEKQAPIIDLEKQQHARHEEDIIRVDDAIPVMHVTESPNAEETPTDISAEKSVNNNANEILKETDVAT